MNILIFNWRDITHPWTGGAEVYIHEIGKRLVNMGHDVTLFCGEYLGCEKESIIDGIKIIRKGGQYSIYLYAPIMYLLKLRNKYDIIIDCENGIPFFTPIFTRKSKICVMHHIHKDIFSIERPFYIAWLGKFLEGYLMPMVYRGTEFIAVSPSTKKEIIELGINKDKIKLIFNGMNGQFIPDWNKKKKNLVVYIGRDKRYKQLDHLVKAFRIVKNEISDAKLIIAGRGNFSEVKELSDELNLDTELHREIDEDQKLDILQKANVFVTPSMKEGWGITVIEANRCGTPAIAYNVSGLRDSIVNNESGLLVESGNIEEIAAAIIKVLKENEFQEKLSKNAFEWSKNFSWDKSAKEFDDIIRDIHK